MKEDILIADFMGWKKSKKGNTYWHPTNSRRYYHKDNLPFSRSWNRLIPVVEKIETLGYRFDISNQIAAIYKNGIHAPASVWSKESTKFKAVYNAIVYFLKNEV